MAITAHHHHTHVTVEAPYVDEGPTDGPPDALVLDIGEDIGALIIHTGAGMLGMEVEISATGQDDQRSHKDVLERQIGGNPAYTAVFDKVREGTYTLWVDDVARERDVHVSGGAIGELRWTDAS